MRLVGPVELQLLRRLGPLGPLNEPIWTKECHIETCTSGARMIQTPISTSVHCLPSHAQATMCPKTLKSYSVHRLARANRRKMAVYTPQRPPCC